MVEYLTNAKYGDVYKTGVRPSEFVEALLRTGYFQPPWRINVTPIVEIKSEYYRETATLRGLSIELSCEPSIFINILRAVLADFLGNYGDYVRDTWIHSLVDRWGWYSPYSKKIALKQVEIVVYPRDTDFYMQWTIPCEELEGICQPVRDPVKVEMLSRDEKKWREFKKALIEVLNLRK